MKSFTRYINSATGDTPESICDDCDNCAAQVLCTSERLKMIKDETKKFNLDIIQSETDTTFDVTLSEQNVADLIVLSVLGRLIGKKDSERKQTLSYMFNEYNDTLVPEFDTCKFEKILYVTLLCTTIAILILLLVLQMEKNKPPQDNTDHKQSSFDPKQKYTIIPTNGIMAFGNQLKYRV